MLPSAEDCLCYVIAAKKGLENMPMFVCVLDCIHITLDSYKLFVSGLVVKQSPRSLFSSLSCVSRSSKV